MDKRKIKQLFFEMLDLCNATDDPTLIEASKGIFRDIELSDDINDFADSANELMVFVSEVNLDCYDTKEVISEIERIYQQFLELIDEFE